MAVPRVRAQGRRRRPIDLQPIDRYGAKMSQRGVPDAEVVDDDADPTSFSPRRVARAASPSTIIALGDLEMSRRDPAPVSARTRDTTLRPEPGAVELARETFTETGGRLPVAPDRGPIDDLPAGRREDQPADREDQACLLRERDEVSGATNPRSGWVQRTRASTSGTRRSPGRATGW